MQVMGWKFKAEQLPDCESNLWYVTDCEIKGVVGLSAKSLDELKTVLKLAIPEIIDLNGLPKS